MPPYHLVDATSWEEFVYFALASVSGFWPTDTIVTLGLMALTAS